MLIYEINLLITILRNELLVPRAFCLLGLQNLLHFIRPGAYCICKILTQGSETNGPRFKLLVSCKLGLVQLGTEL